MTSYSRGDVVLVRYQASAEGEPWLRPAVVVSSETYQQGRGQVLLAAVTSNERAPQTGDTVLQGWREAGLIGPSVATGVLLTLTPESIVKRLGELTVLDAQGVESSLRLSLGV